MPLKSILPNLLLQIIYVYYYYVLLLLFVLLLFNIVYKLKEHNIDN